MKAENVPDQFVQDLIDCQPRLHAYILSLLPNWSDANDVLQETNPAMWRFFGGVRPGHELRRLGLQDCPLPSPGLLPQTASRAANLRRRTIRASS